MSKRDNDEIVKTHPEQERLTQMLEDASGDTMVICVACGELTAEKDLYFNARWAKHTCEDCYYKDLKNPEEHQLKDK